MVTISVGRHSTAYGQALWTKGDIACIKIGDRLVQGKIIRRKVSKPA
jgi:hypothetical protein